MKNPIPTQSENPNGLHGRYRIQKAVLVGGGIEPFEPEKYEFVDPAPDAEYFVLRLDEVGKDRKHIAAGRIAIHAYAEAIKDHIPKLAADLIERYPLLDI